VSLQGPHDNQSAAEIGKGLVDTINNYWRDRLQQEHGIESCLEMEFETHFRQFFMPTTRGTEHGSKKRYAGLIDNDKGERKIIYKGLETVRTDWTELARQFQQNLYQLICDGEEYADYLRQTVADLYAGKLDQQLVYRKRRHKKLSEYQKNIPPHAQAAIKAEAEFRQKGQPSH